MPEARETRKFNGLRTADNGDVTQANRKPGEVGLQLAGPPCPSFSMGGKGAGRAAMPAVLRGVQDLRQGREPDYAGLIAQTGDERTGLVLQPLRLALEGLPTYLIWEQVPTVLPIWNACAVALQDHGYETAVGVLDAADFGAAQHRKRAVLIARLDGHLASLPAPTVSEYKPMSEAIGWGMTKRPSYTVTGGGTNTGGAEPFGGAARKGMQRQYDEGNWFGPLRLRVNAAESAILQGFPDWFQFRGSMGRQHMQSGNAVQGDMARALLASIPSPR